MAENWVQVEDDPDIINAEVDEAIELLENVNFFDNAFIDDEYEPEDVIPISPNAPFTSFLDAESCVDSPIFTTDSISQVIDSKDKSNNW